MIHIVVTSIIPKIHYRGKDSCLPTVVGLWSLKTWTKGRNMQKGDNWSGDLFTDSPSKSLNAAESGQKL
jgi:hypothetical protein